jgi:hypothetical protein
MWVAKEPKDFCTEYMLRNYKRNEQLIDLTKIPTDIRAKILEVYNEQENKKGKNIMGYFMANRLKNLTESIGDFL